jgi:DNA-directed RNA polymerase subunit RPC12/RpoP
MSTSISRAQGKAKTAYQEALENIEETKKRECNQLAVNWSQADEGDLKVACPTCGHPSAPRCRGVKRTIITSIGEVTYSRHYYTCPSCGHGFYPQDEVVQRDLGHGSMTRDLTELALDMALNDPYELASERFKFHHGIEISRSGFQRLVEEAGQKLAEKKTKHRAR